MKKWGANILILANSLKSPTLLACWRTCRSHPPKKPLPRYDLDTNAEKDDEQ